MKPPNINIKHELSETDKLLKSGKISKRQAAAMKKCLRTVGKIEAIVKEAIRR